jgi:hypothetical protein
MNACLSVCGPTDLVIPARRATLLTIRPAPCRSRRRPSPMRKDGAVAAFAGGQVDRPGSAGRQRDGDDLAALTGDRQRPVSPLQAQVLDIGAGGLGDSQAVQREQGDQRVLGRRPEPSSHQQGSQLVAVQGGGMRLVVQPRAADMHGRGHRLEHDEEGHADRLIQGDPVGRVGRGAARPAADPLGRSGQRLGEPFAHVALAAGAGRAEQVEADAAGDRGQPGTGGCDGFLLLGGHGVPARVGLLDGVLGVGQRTQQPVGEIDQPPPLAHDRAQARIGRAAS